MTALPAAPGARRPAVLAIVLGAIAVAFGVFFGETYIPRLPRHAGYYLVAVDDAVHEGAPPRPGRTVVVVVDGLRRESALGMKSVAVLRGAGQCRSMNVGPLTVSRPVYAILSTGLEADRTGSRNNDETSPLAAESIWDVARESGLEVIGASHLPWFGQLFPRGFTRYHRTEPIADDIFAREPLGDLDLFHPIYVDEAGHSFGAASAEYAAMVARADREVSGLLARLDLAHDVVVFTADHGHIKRGGHGSSQPEIANVLTCFAGAGILRRDEAPAFDARTLAPTLALRLGLRFPRNMRAGEDDLDTMFDIVDLGASPAYAADRRGAIAHFRDENAKAIEGWLSGGGRTWSALYARDRTKSLQRMGGGLALYAVLFALVSRRAGIAWRSMAATALWGLGLFGTAVALHVALRGSFDFTAVNSRASYVPACLGIGFVAGLAAIGVHLAVARSASRLLRDQLTALAFLLGLNVLHPLAFGWPLGFPLPARQLLLFPFFGAILLVAGGLLTVALGVVVLRRRTPRLPAIRDTATGGSRSRY